jgi:hypothetical protein
LHRAPHRARVRVTLTIIAPGAAKNSRPFWAVELGLAGTGSAPATPVVGMPAAGWRWSVPSGSLPGPVYVARGTRMRLHRVRRCAQISRIVLRHGLAPYLRGLAEPSRIMTACCR